DLLRFDAFGPKPSFSKQNSLAVILWNHRWEYDKNPVAFFNALYKLIDRGIEFKVIIAGENTRQKAEEFDEARQRLASRLIHFGHAECFEDYAKLLWQASIAVSCSWQDFFGVSMCEAIYCGCLPLLPSRLNYPNLIPAAYHEQCLYLEGGLALALEKVLNMPA